MPKVNKKDIEGYCSHDQDDLFVKREQTWQVYMIRCKDGSLYTGITTNIVRRVAEHQSQGKKCAKYLRGRGPLKLVYSEAFGTRTSALRAEMWLKGLSKAKKEKLVGEQATFQLIASFVKKLDGKLLPQCRKFT